jgi:acyl-CoA synthetase (AMP-forming)/AMP-acid ligase II/thioesterase domain-containing protein/acyl carrier protein
MDLRKETMTGTMGQRRENVTYEGEKGQEPRPQYLGIHHLLKAQAERISEAIAIAAPGRTPLTYGGLFAHVEDVIKTLNSMGVGRNDRVAIVLPNGPEMALAFVAVAAGATSAPLNPAYRQTEFDFYLSDLNAKALIVGSDMDSPARGVAQARDIPIIELTSVVEEEAGIFTLSGGDGTPPTQGGCAVPDDVALVLHTSGTTSRPKIVPLTQANICTSAHNIRASFELTESDRCLNVMPLFHIHGLIGAALSSLTAGASIVCTPGFAAPEFFDWLETFRPTWYTAVPTMHQAVLARVETNRDIVADCPLRFIRSCSASLPPHVMAELESAFDAPVVESYGMTEASHQISSNPLPPRQRKPGSVGPASGPEVAIMDEVGNLLPPGETGEIVIRGANVTHGYENNPTANQSAFTNGWFRTGDQGYMDEDSYFYLTGRIKEIINRGGEKIAPREVDEALMDHPGVAQAVAFAVPHRTLGEDMAAAVVLRENGSVTEKDLREFAFARLADYKVPSQIIVVDEIPKGPTGKLQRIGLAEKLAQALAPEFAAPRNSVEDTLAGIWAESLGLERVGIHDNFFALGGDSLLAARVVTDVQSAFGLELALSTVFQAPTVEQFASLLVENGKEAPGDSLVLLRDGESEPPVFCLPGTLGNVHNDLGALAQHLGPERPVYGLQDGIQNPSKIEDLAAHYIDEVRHVQPEGPYFLVGVCSGGTIAFEMAQQLQARQQHVAMLGLVEPAPPYIPGLRSYYDLASFILRQTLRHFGRHSRYVSQLNSPERRTYIRLRRKLIANQWALRRYTPQPYSGSIHLYLTNETLNSPDNPRLGWRKLATKDEIHAIPGTHNSVTGMNDAQVEEAHMQALAEQLRASIDDVLTKA